MQNFSRCSRHLLLPSLLTIAIGCDKPFAGVAAPIAPGLLQVAVNQQLSESESTTSEEGNGSKSDAKAAKKNSEEFDIRAWKAWPQPKTTLLLTGEQHGYIEPCGCTGLENQKGGLARRHTLIKQVKEQGWELVPLDVGNQVRRYGPQAGIKFQTTVTALRKLGYRAVGFGPDDLRLDVGLLLSEAAADPEAQLQFVSANVTLLDPELLPTVRVVESGGRTIGVTSVLDATTIKQALGDEITVAEVVPAIKAALADMTSKACDFKVLLYYGDNDAEEDVARIAQQVPGYDLVVIANEFGEPMFQPKNIENSDTKLILTGHKGMHACLIGLYEKGQPFRYGRVPLTAAFEDSREMMQSLATYQDHLKNLSYEGLGLKAIPHASGNEFVGTEKCGECHTTALDIWEDTPHAHATESLVHPPNDRSEVPRHFDPECLSCHVTGWSPQGYYPFTSGYESLETTSQMVANGCENCHGPGSQHVAAEEGDIDASDIMLDKLRASMRLPLSKAREQCMECHDLDNSPDFHEPGAFEEYWKRVEHIGKD